ncbi:MAG: molybdopterin-binding protein [Gemmatales bacterium]|nr:molybdopterin-binding protein [Gemmatales bacterium]MCS7159637.1 molybdopterin-binding protein [Gemmatales bacterium]MDW8174835.1 molybdopterin-binding protein [Gemmatales bacterium]MDW8221937.1 molybdopterin-binding protein [Gemmatales bacterium]
MAADSRTTKIRAAVITVSDTRSERDDVSGQTIRQIINQAQHEAVYSTIVPDEPEQIRQIFRDLEARPDIDVVILTGGTGIAPRDQTYEVVSSLLEKRLDGFGELFRYLSYQEIGSAAMLSRAVGGIWRGRLVFSLPGSPAAVRLALEKLILPQLSHAVALVRGQPSPHPKCVHQTGTASGSGALVSQASATYLRPLEHVRFDPKKMGKVTLFNSPRLFLGLNCFQPGQEHQLHTHAGQDKAYLVLQGQGVFLVPDGEQPMREGDLLIAPAEAPHGIRNTGNQGLIVLVIMAPAPGQSG